MAINIPPELLTRHPEWAGGAPQQPAATQPPLPTPMPQGVNAPQSTSLGTLPVSTALEQLYPAVAPTQGFGSPEIAQWQATENLLSAEQRSIGADRAAYAVQPQIRAAEGNVLNAQETDIGANRALISEQTRALDAQRARQQAIQDAKVNTEDIKNVGRAQRERDVVSYRYNLAGLPNPIEITLPSDFKGPLPAGIVKRLQTLAEILQEKDADATKSENFNVEAARLHTANTGLAVTAAQIASGRVKLSLDEVEQAAKLAGLDVRQANLALSASRQPPIPGLVFDDTTGTWVTSSVAAINKGVEQQRISEIIRSRTNADAGTYGSIPVDSLISAYVLDGGISEYELRQGLAENDVPPQTIEVYVRIANARKAAAVNEKDRLVQELLKQFGFSSTTGDGTTSTSTGRPTIQNNTPAYSSYLTSQEREDIR